MELPGTLLADIHEAALDPSRWTGLAPAIAAALDGGSAQLQVRGPEPGRILRLTQTGNYDEWASHAYRTEFGPRDPWVAGGASAALRAVVGTEFVSEDDLLASDFYQDFLRRIDVFHVAGMVMPIADGAMLSFGVHRDRRAPAFDDNSLRLVETLCRHLRQSIRVSHRLALLDARGGASLSALDQLGVAALALASDGRLLFANRAGEAVLARPGPMTVRHGIVCLSDTKREPEFRALVRQAAATAVEAGTDAGGVLRLPHADGDTELLIAPLRPGSAGLMPWPAGAIVFVSVPRLLSPAASRLLAERYDLTQAETRLLTAVLCSRSAAAYAGERRLSRNTIKTQMRSLLAKTGHPNAAKLRDALAADPILRLMGRESDRVD